MRNIEDCSKEEMTSLLKEIQSILWLDDDENGEFWNPDLQWSPDTVEEISEVLEDFRPVERKYL